MRCGPASSRELGAREDVPALPTADAHPADARPREIALAGAVISVVGFILFFPHIRHGGFYDDDWSNALFYRSLGYRGMAEHFVREEVPWRPVLAALLPAPHALFGVTVAGHLAVALALAVLVSLSFFVFLRALRVELPHALALAALSILFPRSDAVRLWATASINNVAVVCYFLGFVAATHAMHLQPPARGRSRLLHGLASLLYLTSVLTYEVAAPVILLSGLLYRTRLPWRAVRARWLADAALVLVPLAVLVVPASRTRGIGTLAGRLTDIPEFVIQGASLLASTFLPSGVSSAAMKLLVLGAVAGVVVAAAWRAQRDQDRELAKWLRRAAIGTAAAALAYPMFLGYGLYPLSDGFENRVNMFSEFGFIVVTYSCLALLAHLIARNRPRLVFAVLTVGTLLVTVGFAQRLRNDIRLYDAAAAHQRYQLATLRRLLPDPPNGSTILTFRHRTSTAPGVWILEVPWVFTAAVNVLWQDPSLTVIPVVRPRGVACAEHEAHVDSSGRAYSVTYGRADFVDVASHSLMHVASKQDCLKALAAIRGASKMRGGRAPPL